MQYRAFTIRNFKGVRELRLDLSREPRSRIFTLVGLNESGKTTILQALDWFANPEHYRPSDLIPRARRANFNDKISVQAHVQLSVEDEEEIARYLEERHGFIKCEPIDQITVMRCYDYEGSELVKKPNVWSVRLVGKKRRGTVVRALDDKDEAWQSTVKYIRHHMFPPIIYYENFLFDFPDYIYLTSANADEARQDTRYKRVLQDVLSSLRMDLLIERHLVQRFEQGGQDDLDNIQAVLDVASAKVTDVVLREWQQIIRTERKNVQIVFGPGLQKDPDGALKVAVRVKDGQESYYIRERSLGFRWFFGFIMFTHFRTYRDNQRENALFLLDEPASNLHPAAQTKLLEALEALPNKQVVIYSTHSHHMINPAWLAGTYVVRNVGQDYTGVDLEFATNQSRIEADRYFEFVSAHPRDKDLYWPILEALDYKPGPLEMVPDIVIVEGKNDFYTLRYMIDVQGIVDSSNLGVYPSTGKDKTTDIAALYLAWGRNFTILLDGDQGGQETEDRVKKRFGPIMANRVITLGDVDPRWKGFELEDLFDRRDQLKLTRVSFPDAVEVTKSTLNTGLQAAFLQKNKVPLTKYTLDRFAKLIQELQRRMRNWNAEVGATLENKSRAR